MKRFFLICLCISLLRIGFCSEPLKIAVISDVHFLGTSIAQSSPALEKYENTTGRNVTDLHTVLSQTLGEIEKAGTDILLISGDITNHGERASHLEFIDKLKPLKARGMQIFVIPGNHDINVPDAKSYTGNTPDSTPSISPEEFEQLYAPFGYEKALQRDTASLSYLAVLNDSLWLLSFDTNRYREHKTTSISEGRILPQTMAWALRILRQAKEQQTTVLGMMHHGLVEHLPYQSAFFSAYLIDDWKKNATVLADNGLKVVFTGHFHANDITQLTTPNGNTIFDVETGSLAQYPFPYRLMSFNGESLTINTHYIESIPKTPDLQEKYRLKMQTFARRAIDARLRRMNMPIADDVREALVELLTHIQTLHAKGDEKPDGQTLKSVEKLAAIFGDEGFEMETFQLDFPPADNHVIIDLK